MSLELMAPPDGGGGGSVDSNESVWAAHLAGHSSFLIASGVFLASFASNFRQDHTDNDSVRHTWIVGYTQGGEVSTPWPVQTSDLRLIARLGLTPVVILADGKAVRTASEAGLAGKFVLLPVPNSSAAAEMANVIERSEDHYDGEPACPVAGACSTLGYLAGVLRCGGPAADQPLSDALVFSALLLAENRRDSPASRAVASSLGLGANGLTGAGAIARLSPRHHIELRGDAAAASLFDRAIEQGWPADDQTQIISAASVLGRDASEAETDHTIPANDRGTSDSHEAPTAQGRLSPSTGSAVVLLRDLPPPTNTEDAVTLHRYQALRAPVPLKLAPEPRAVVATLMAELPWLSEAISKVEQEIALARLSPKPAFAMRPILLVGLPGVGKSRFARRLARAVGTPFRMLNATSASAAWTLAGAARTYRSATPCLPVRVIAETNVANPMVCIDEVESGPGQGVEQVSLIDTLLPMLERETSQRYEDPFLMAPCDISQVAWVGTCNSIDQLPDRFLQRFQVINVPPIPPTAFEGILTQALDDLAAELRTVAESLPALPSPVVEALRQGFEATLSARLLSNAVRDAMGAIAAGSDPVPPVAARFGLLATKQRTPMGFHHAA